MTEHRFEFVSSFLHDGCRAACPCGWEGPEREDAQQASADFEAHRADVAKVTALSRNEAES